MRPLIGRAHAGTVKQGHSRPPDCAIHILFQGTVALHETPQLGELVPVTESGAGPVGDREGGEGIARSGFYGFHRV